MQTTLVSIEIIFLVKCSPGAIRCGAEMRERFHHVILHRRPRDAQFLVDLAVAAVFGPAHRKDAFRSLRKRGESLFERQKQLLQLHMRLLVGSAFWLAALMKLDRSDPRAPAPCSIDQYRLSDTAEKAAWIEQMRQLRAQRRPHENFVDEIVDVLRLRTSTQKPAHRIALGAIESVEDLPYLRRLLVCI
nr:hypothetical protein [Erythrobacter sp.]